MCLNGAHLLSQNFWLTQVSYKFEVPLFTDLSAEATREEEIMHKSPKDG